MIFLLRKIYSATCYSFSGLVFAFKDQYAFRCELIASFIMIPLAFYLGQTLLIKIVLFISWMMILMIELINSAVEVTIDRIGLEHHPLSKEAKDMGSAAVFIAWITWFVVWVVALCR